MRVLHVSEAMGGGVTSAVLAMVEATPEIEHHLFAKPRTQHDTGADLLSGFATVHRMSANPFVAVRTLRSLQRDLFPDVVHAHSSFGGVLARVAGAHGCKIAYSPHCFGFERRDISAMQHRTIVAVERLLVPRTDLFVAVAPYELDLAATLGHRDVAYVPNRTMLEGLAHARHRTPLRVVTIGRICHQKDWRYFIHLKQYVDRHVAADLDWTWLGGGDPDGEAALARAGVRVSGWINRDRLLDELTTAQAYVHTAAWEAAPISILEAAGLGVPLVLRSIPPLDSLHLPGRSTSVAGMAVRLADMVDRTAWQQASAQSLELAARHSVGEQADTLREAYARVTGTPLPPGLPHLPTVTPRRPDGTGRDRLVATGGTLA